MFLSVAGSKTLTLLKDLVAPKKPAEASFEKLMKALRDFYAPKWNVLSERYIFHSRKQLSGETLAECIASLMGLAATCEFGAGLEEQLRDQLVYGVSCKELRGKLLRVTYGKNLTWAKVLYIVTNFESTARSMHQFQQMPSQPRKDHLNRKLAGHRQVPTGIQGMSDQKGGISKPCSAAWEQHTFKATLSNSSP